MTHADLVLSAAAWLRARRCSVVITEMVSAAGETADAVGFNSWRSTLIECKTSRADFRVDAHKPFRRAGRGIGNERFFLVPQDLLRVEELPAGWGLLELKPDGRVRVKVESGNHEAEKEREVALLISSLRRVALSPLEGISVKPYTINTACTATIGILPESPQPNPERIVP
jgi:hypothetical protein